MLCNQASVLLVAGYWIPDAGYVIVPFLTPDLWALFLVEDHVIGNTRSLTREPYNLNKLHRLNKLSSDSAEA
jgi:hypothetical protein